MKIRGAWRKLAGASVTVVAMLGLFAGSLAEPSGTETAVGLPPLQTDVLNQPAIEAESTEREALIAFQSSSFIPDDVVRAESADVVPVSTGSFGSGDLGAGETITLLRPAGRRDVDVAVAEGLAFTGFRTTVLVPAAIHEVQLDMSIDGASVFSATVAGGSTEELSFLLETPIVNDAVLSISVEERYGATCTSTAVEPSALRLVDNEFFFERLDARPQTIADFFPPVLDGVIVVMDPTARSSVRSAAFELSTALARRYPKMPAVDVLYRTIAVGQFAERRAADVPVSDGLFTRTIVLTEAPTASMSLRQGVDGAYLEIAGPDGLLERMAAAVSAPELAFVTKASVQVEELESMEASPDLLAVRSLRDVGVRRLETSGSRVLQLPVSLPQAAFGEPVREIRVRIGGVVVASGASGRDPILTLWLNGDLQDAIDYDGSGRFDLEFVIDASQVERDNQLLIRSELPLDCGDELPNHELTLDAASWVDAEAGQSLPASLDRFPQVAVGHLSVATGATENELEVAMTTVGVLQGASPLPIHPQAASIERVLGGFASALVVTDGRGDLAAVMARDLTTVQSDQLAFVSNESPEDLAFLSTSITQTNQNLLVVFSPTETIGRSLVDELADRGWSAFTGNAVGVRGNGDVIRTETPTSAQAEAALATLVDPPEPQLSIARQLGLGALTTLVVVVAAMLIRFVLGALRRLR